MTIYYCKMCGRAVKSETKPNYCYFDRVDHIENVSDEDAIKMGIVFNSDSIYEFPGDVRFDPITGESIDPDNDGFTLEEFQLNIIERVKND